MPSVMKAAMNSAEASNSFCPLLLGNRLVERIQISSGMLKMRVSVMEFGRFTAGTGWSGQTEPKPAMARLSSTAQGESNAQMKNGFNHKGHEVTRRKSATFVSLVVHPWFIGFCAGRKMCSIPLGRFVSGFLGLVRGHELSVFCL